MKSILPVLALCCGIAPDPCFGATEPAAAGMVINSGTPWVVADGQPEAMQRALQDVGRDWYKVFGRRPVVVKAVPASWRGPVICLGLTGSWRAKLVTEPFAGPESFLLRVQRDEAGRPALVGAGADMRGSIYAAYAMSEEKLDAVLQAAGETPLWFAKVDGVTEDIGNSPVMPPKSEADGNKPTAPNVQALPQQ